MSMVHSDSTCYALGLPALRNKTSPIDVKYPANHGQNSLEKKQPAATVHNSQIPRENRRLGNTVVHCCLKELGVCTHP